MEAAAGGGGDVDATVGTGVGAIGFAGFSSAVGQLQQAAANGVELDPESANALINALKSAHGRATDALRELQNVARGGPPLGSTPAADTYKSTFAKAAHDPTQGGVTAYKKLRDDVEDAIKTVQQCVKDTQATEHDTAGIFGGFEI